MNEISSKIKDAKLNKISQIESFEDAVKSRPEIFLHPMSQWHLYSEFKNGVSAGGRIEYVRLFGVVGVFVLMLACINFMNLATARSEKRAKEVGIRKSIGSVRAQLISQFLSESLLVVIFAFAIALLLVQLSLPWFNQLADKQISILWSSPLFWVLGIGFTLITGLIAGSYPAFVLSSFNPVKVLKGTLRAGRLAATPRKVLVVIQFTVSITLIIGTVVVFRQIQHAQQRPVGYSQNALISLPIRANEIRTHYDALKNELLATGAVTEMSASENPVTATFTTNSGFTWKDKDPNMADEFVTMCITSDFGKTIGWQIQEGRDFSKDIASDSSGFIIN
jgi:putative ABC transport system permease protein